MTWIVREMKAACPSAHTEAGGAITVVMWKMLVSAASQVCNVKRYSPIAVYVWMFRKNYYYALLVYLLALFDTCK